MKKLGILVLAMVFVFGISAVGMAADEATADQTISAIIEEEPVALDVGHVNFGTFENEDGLEAANHITFDITVTGDDANDYLVNVNEVTTTTTGDLYVNITEDANFDANLLVDGGASTNSVDDGETILFDNLDAGDQTKTANVEVEEVVGTGEHQLTVEWAVNAQ